MIQTELIDTMCRIEEFCAREHIDHRFVGGCSYVGWIKEDTSVDIDIPHRIIRLKSHAYPETLRSDGSIRDIDIFIMSSDIGELQKVKKFMKAQSKIQTAIPVFKYVSVESIIGIYHKRHLVPQLVTAISEYAGKPYLSFDEIMEEIHPNTLEKWTLVTQDGLSFSVRNPYADLLAYHLRVPSGIKPKDKEKVVHLVRLVEQLKEIGRRTGIQYDDRNYFGSWLAYKNKIASAKGMIRVKATITRTYWDTIGDTLSRGRGPLGNMFMKLSNQFTGGAQ